MIELIFYLHKQVMDTYKQFDFENIQNSLLDKPNETIFELTKIKQDLKTMNNQTNDERIQYEGVNIYGTLLDLMIYYLKHFDGDQRQFEDIYQKLITDDFVDEPTFPRHYKLEFMSIGGKLFTEYNWFSRSEQVIELFKSLYDSCYEEEKVDIGFKYIELLSILPFKIWSIYYKNSSSYVDFIKTLGLNQEFSEHQLKLIDFNCEKIGFDYGIFIRSNNSFKHYYRCSFVYYELQNHHLIHKGMKMVHQLLDNFPDRAIELYGDFKEMSQIGIDNNDDNNKIDFKCDSVK